MKILLIIIVSIFCQFFNVLGQTTKINQAAVYFKNNRYSEANNIYKDLILNHELSIIENETEFRKSLITSEKCRDYFFKYDIFSQIRLTEEYTFEDAFAFFQLSLFLGDYLNAIEILNCPIVLNSVDPRKKNLDQYKNGIVWEEIKKDSCTYKFKKVDFNSGTGDFNPTYHPKGIVFTSCRKKNRSSFDNLPFLNIYLIHINKRKIENLKFLKSLGHSGTSIYDSINKIWYYAKNLSINKINSLIPTGIFIYDETNHTEIAFEFNDSDYYLAQPSLSDNGQKLWFSSNKPGGFGKADIWFSNKTLAGWSEPINAGNNVNSSEDEMFPFSLKNELFFSSNGHPGLGGLDLFSVNITNSNVSNLTNLGGNINSNYDDFSLVIDNSEKSGYFSSNRENFVDNIYSLEVNRLEFVFIGSIISEMNSDQIKLIDVVVKQNDSIIDVLHSNEQAMFEFKGKKNQTYKFEINNIDNTVITETHSTFEKIKSDSIFMIFNLSNSINPNVNLIVKVIDKTTKINLFNSKIRILNKKTNEIETYTTNEVGEINIKLMKNIEYDFYTNHVNYIENSTLINLKSIDSIITLELELIKLGSTIVIKNLNYDFNKWELKIESKNELDRIITFLIENPQIKIELKSYTDCRGSAEFNMDLSEKRNLSSIEYIVSKGIKRERIIGKSYGESKILNRCLDDVNCSENEHKINRRTEIKVISLM